LAAVLVPDIKQLEDELAVRVTDAVAVERTDGDGEELPTAVGCTRGKPGVANADKEAVAVAATLTLGVPVGAGVDDGLTLTVAGLLTVPNTRCSVYTVEPGPYATILPPSAEQPTEFQPAGEIADHVAP
jgi:hypothetical protein